LRLIKIPAIDSTGLTPEGKAPSELPNKEQTLKDAFAQNSGETSPISDDKNGNYFVVRTDEITPSAPKPYDAVKTTIAAAWKAHEQAVKSIALAEKIGKALQDGKPASAFADEDGVSVRVSSPLSEMGDTDSQLPPDIIAKAFKIKKGETINGAKDNKQIVVRLASITDIDLSKTDPRKGMIDINIKKDTSDELLDQYLHHLYDVFPVTTNAALLDRIRQEN